MNYFDTAENFANENFSNYDGWNNFTDDYNYADGGSEGTALSSLPFVINISNSTTADVANVVFLNANLAGNTTTVSFGNAAAITITMDGTITYAEFLQDIKSSPFKVGQMYLQSANANQPFKTLTITNREANGRKVELPINPRLDPMQNQAGVSIVRTEFTVNSFTSIATTILGSATLIVSLYPKEQIDVARSLSGQTVAKAYSKPNLSQLQMPSNRGLVG
jgi:hypothetical protein